MVTANPRDPQRREHHPAGAHDFPALDPAQLICRACSYSDDGLPLTPTPWPCPVPGDAERAERETPQGRHTAAVHLAGEVAARRTSLGLTKNQLAKQCGLSLRTIQHIEAARPAHPSRASLEALDRGLLWERDSAARVLEGGVPLPLPLPLSPHAGVPVEQRIVLQAGLPADVEATLSDHLHARRQQVEAALEEEARLLVGQTLRLVRLARKGARQAGRHFQ